MQRWISFFAGVGVVVLAVVLMVKGSAGRKPPVVAIDGASSLAAADAGDLIALDAESIDGGELGLGDFAPPMIREVHDGGPGYDMPTGGQPPPLAPTAPRKVKYSVILVTYAGAQGVGAGARTRAAAQELAAKVAEDAKADFRGASTKGDAYVDELHADRNILEPATEYLLFMAQVGDVVGPMDTPRGYWIVKRLE